MKSFVRALAQELIARLAGVTRPNWRSDSALIGNKPLSGKVAAMEGIVMETFAGRAARSSCRRFKPESEVRSETAITRRRFGAKTVSSGV